jgi:hypothetical protein
VRWSLWLESGVATLKSCLTATDAEEVDGCARLENYEHFAPLDTYGLFGQAVHT